MIGISVYVSDEDAEERILRASSSGVKLAFTSLHIPEESGISPKRVRDLLSLFKREGFRVFADVSKKTPAMLGLHHFEEVKELGVTSLRLDDGFTTDEMLQLSRQFRIAINASTVGKKELQGWIESGLATENMIAWHNFYPKPETGLDEEYFLGQQNLYDTLGIPVYAFIPGDEKKRGPLHLGLPTLEDHRDQSPYISAVQLKRWGVTGVFVGDPGCSEQLLGKLVRFDQEEVIELSYSGSGEIEGEYQLRPDPGRDVFRLLDTRTESGIPPQHTGERPRGTITQDNDLYGRYRGEIQIVRRNLQSDPKVNVIGRICTEHLNLLELFESGQRIEMKGNFIH
ncbi:MupG family TIM beta-alpha barrel fold protein [Rossellomorea vietnamensis]|uniref:MupG family TIM beta-alpha barrel fold protein n=1 Tax=Rossellomorea vietnamensis TaxID=218284 RepID=A0ACD4C4K5_9BACI|nr:MupG family TIM beta-alpha barrel fold protein [Rossellomorea vietnamensis]UXH43351.1 MupG family TIM beta-alpha barrel fold protein [Rossellomorea vietnamensis]